MNSMSKKKDKPIRVLSLVQECLHKPLGGLGVYMREISKRMANQYGVEYTWFGYDPIDCVGGRPKYHNVDIHHCYNNLQYPQCGELFHQISLEKVFTQNLIDWYGDKEFDIIHLHDSYLWPVACYARALFDAPIIMQSHLSFGLSTPAMHAYSHAPFWRSLFRKLTFQKTYKKYLYPVWCQEIGQEGAAVRNAEMVYTVSNSYSKQLKDFYLTDRDIPVIHNGVDTLPLKAAKRKDVIQMETFEVDDNGKNKKKIFKKRLKTEGRPLIGFTGRCVNEKGIGIVLDLAKRMPDYDFLVFTNHSPHIVSVYPLINHVKECGEKYKNLHVLFNIPFDKKWDYLKACDMGLVPSCFPGGEPFGIVALEWMGLGIPVLIAAQDEVDEHGNTTGGLVGLGGLGDFCNNLNSWLVKPTWKDYMAAIKNFKYNESRVENARKTAENFNWNETARKTMGAYTQCLENFGNLKQLKLQNRLRIGRSSESTTKNQEAQRTGVTMSPFQDGSAYT